MSFVFPEKCIFCGKPVESSEEACSECIKSLPFILGDTCERCGMGKDICTCKVGDLKY